MDGSVFKFVFFFVVENDAIFVKETHNRSFPTGASQEVYDDVEKPILSVSQSKEKTTFSDSQGC